MHFACLSERYGFKEEEGKYTRTFTIPLEVSDLEKLKKAKIQILVGNTTFTIERGDLTKAVEATLSFIVANQELFDIKKLKIKALVADQSGVYVENNELAKNLEAYIRTTLGDLDLSEIQGFRINITLPQQLEVTSIGKGKRGLSVNKQGIITYLLNGTPVAFDGFRFNILLPPNVEPIGAGILKRNVPLELTLNNQKIDPQKLRFNLNLQAEGVEIRDGVLYLRTRLAPAEGKEQAKPKIETKGQVEQPDIVVIGGAIYKKTGPAEQVATQAQERLENMKSWFNQMWTYIVNFFRGVGEFFKKWWEYILATTIAVFIGSFLANLIAPRLREWFGEKFEKWKEARRKAKKEQEERKKWEEWFKREFPEAPKEPKNLPGAQFIQDSLKGLPGLLYRDLITPFLDAIFDFEDAIGITEKAGNVLQKGVSWFDKVKEWAGNMLAPLKSWSEEAKKWFDKLFAPFKGLTDPTTIIISLLGSILLVLKIIAEKATGKAIPFSQERKIPQTAPGVLLASADPTLAYLVASQAQQQSGFLQKASDVLKSIRDFFVPPTGRYINQFLAIKGGAGTKVLQERLQNMLNEASKGIDETGFREMLGKIQREVFRQTIENVTKESLRGIAEALTSIEDYGDSFKEILKISFTKSLQEAGLDIKDFSKAIDNAGANATKAQDMYINAMTNITNVIKSMGDRLPKELREKIEKIYYFLTWKTKKVSEMDVSTLAQILEYLFMTDYGLYNKVLNNVNSTLQKSIQLEKEMSIASDRILQLGKIIEQQLLSGTTTYAEASKATENIISEAMSNIDKILKSTGTTLTFTISNLGFFSDLAEDIGNMILKDTKNAEQYIKRINELNKFLYGMTGQINGLIGMSENFFNAINSGMVSITNRLNVANYILWSAEKNIAKLADKERRLEEQRQSEIQNIVNLNSKLEALQTKRDILTKYLDNIRESINKNKRSTKDLENIAKQYEETIRKLQSLRSFEINQFASIVGGMDVIKGIKGVQSIVEFLRQKYFISQSDVEPLINILTTIYGERYEEISLYEVLLGLMSKNADSAFNLALQLDYLSTIMNNLAEVTKDTQDTDEALTELERRSRDELDKQIETLNNEISARQNARKITDTAIEQIKKMVETIRNMEDAFKDIKGLFKSWIKDLYDDLYGAYTSLLRFSFQDAITKAFQAFENLFNKFFIDKARDSFTNLFYSILRSIKPRTQEEQALFEKWNKLTAPEYITERLNYELSKTNDSINRLGIEVGGALTNLVKSLAPQLGLDSGIISLLGNVLASAGSVIIGGAISFILSRAMPLVEEVGKVLDSIIDLIFNITPLGLAINMAIYGLRTFTQILEFINKVLLLPLQVWVDLYNRLMTNKFNTFIERISKILEKIYTMILAPFMKIWDTIFATFENTIVTGLAVLAQMLAPIIMTLQVLSPIIRWIFDQIYKVTRASATLALKGLKAITDAVVGILRFLNQLPLIGSLFTDALNTMVGFSEDLAEALENIARPLDYASDVAEDIGESASGLTNVPEGFKVALKRFEAMESQIQKIVNNLPIIDYYTRLGTFSAGQIEQTYYNQQENYNISIGNVNITTNDPEEFLNELERLVERRKYIKNGRLSPAFM